MLFEAKVSIMYIWSWPKENVGQCHRESLLLPISIFSATLLCQSSGPRSHGPQNYGTNKEKQRNLAEESRFFRYEYSSAQNQRIDKMTKEPPIGN